MTLPNIRLQPTAADGIIRPPRLKRRVRPHEQPSRMIRKHIASGTRLAIQLSSQERDVVLERAFLDPDVEAQLRLAASAGAKLIVHLDLDDIDDLLGCVAAEANHCNDKKVGRVLDAVCDRLVRLLDSHTDDPPAEPPPMVQPKPPFTAKQGQYLAFIYYYTKIHRLSPAEADLQRYFKVTAPAVHTMILGLERRGLIERTPGQARSIRLRVPASELPDVL